LPDGFGSVATNMSSIFNNTSLPNGFTLPARFGSLATNMTAMFYNTSLPATNFILPAGFGSAATNMMPSMWQNAILNGDIDWSGTDLTNSAAIKANMFSNTTWNGHYIIVQNPGTKTFLITNSSISDDSRIKIKGSVLKTENSNPSTFLDVPNPARNAITKISFQKTLPTCNNPVDVSNDSDNSVLACVENNTEIVVGADGFVISNPDSSNLFKNLSISDGVDINLTNLITPSTVNMNNMFANTKLKSIPIWSNDFGSKANEIVNMFYNTNLPANFSLPAGFGSMAKNTIGTFANTNLSGGITLPAEFGNSATNIYATFANTILPDGFTLPPSFGKVATDMNAIFLNATLLSKLTLPPDFGKVATSMDAMFFNATLNGDIDWSGTNLSNSQATKNDTFQNTKWNNHFILAQNQGSVDWLTNGTGATKDNVKIKGS
jgi:hypothetical protein